MTKYPAEKEKFANLLNNFTKTLGVYIAKDNQWTIRGFIDIFKNVYTISADTKIISKVLELHIFPQFIGFAEENGYKLELATCQNWYPDLTFILKENPNIKFAVDLKTTYRDEKHPGFCNGFTLGSHGEYFINRDSTKNIQYPYNSYGGHFCLGIIYTRSLLDKFEETKRYLLDDLESIPAIVSNFIVFVQEKWKIASDKAGSGNTANIGSIQNIDDILAGNGVFAKAGEEIFDDYWSNFGKMQVVDKKGKHKALSAFAEYLTYRQLPLSLNTPKALKKKV